MIVNTSLASHYRESLESLLPKTPPHAAFW